MDKRCFGDVCDSLETQDPDKAAECVKKSDIDEDIDECKLFLPLLWAKDFISELEGLKGHWNEPVDI